MRVQTEKWKRFIPGVRMYKGKKTLFYNGENLLYSREELLDEDTEDDEEEKESWEVIIVLPGVKVIPEIAFMDCKKVETVIMADTVKSIEDDAFSGCKSLAYIRLSKSLDSIGWNAFEDCVSLKSVFIPPSCRMIGMTAFADCRKLKIFVVNNRFTQIESRAIDNTALEKMYDDRSPCLNHWIKRINKPKEYALHKTCSLPSPLLDIIHEIVIQQDLSSFHRQNSIGITPLQYLEENPYAEVDQMNIINRYILDIMGEIV